MLKELYYGKVIPCERKNRVIEEQQEIVKIIADEEKYFASKLTPEDYERFQELTDLYSKLSGSEEVEAFTYGITMGTILMMDIMDVAKSMKFE